MASSLFEAVESGTVEDFPEALKKFAAQVNVPNDEGYTPLQIAVKNRNVKLAKLLLDQGANPNIPNSGNSIHKGYTATHIAAKNGDVDLINLLAKAGADLNFEGSDSWLPIHCAAFAGKRTGILALLDNGAKIDGRNRHGLTALMYCANHGKATETRDLVSRGADIKAKDQNGDTCLHHALQYQMFKLFEGEYDMPECQYDTVVLLAMNGADPDTPNNEGALCTTYAVEGLRDALRILSHHKNEFATSLTEWNYMTLLSARIEHFVGMGLPLRHANDLYEAMKKCDATRLTEKKKRDEEKANQGGCPIIRSKKKTGAAAPEIPKDGSDPSGGQCPFFQKKEGGASNTAAVEAPKTDSDPSGGKCPHFQKKPEEPVKAAPVADPAPTSMAKEQSYAPIQQPQSPSYALQYQQAYAPQPPQPMTLSLQSLYDNRTAVLMCVICFLLGALLERKLKFT
jgi:ankyrin repeat protein